MKEPYKPRITQEFWCNSCDARIVNSDKPETGSFFLQSGHSYSSASNEFDGAYVMVMYALCSACKTGEL